MKGKGRISYTRWSLLVHRRFWRPLGNRCWNLSKKPSTEIARALGTFMTLKDALIGSELYSGISYASVKGTSGKCLSDEQAIYWKVTKKKEHFKNFISDTFTKRTNKLWNMERRPINVVVGMLTRYCQLRKYLEDQKTWPKLKKREPFIRIWIIAAIHVKVNTSLCPKKCLFSNVQCFPMNWLIGTRKIDSNLEEGTKQWYDIVNSAERHL